jgi:hypothetical protein
VTRVGDYIEAHPVLNSYGQRGNWRGIVTHVGDFDGKPTISAIGVNDGQVTHLSSYSDPVDVIHPAESDMARVTVAGLYNRPGMSERNKNRLLEISQIVAFRRIAEMFPEDRDNPQNTLDLIYGIVYSDSGPASTQLREEKVTR